MSKSFADLNILNVKIITIRIRGVLQKLRFRNRKRGVLSRRQRYRLRNDWGLVDRRRRIDPILINGDNDAVGCAVNGLDLDGVGDSRVCAFVR